MNIPFNVPYLSGKEKEYVSNAINGSKIRSDQSYTEKCVNLIKKKWGYREVHLTASCTSALEMSAILTGIKSGDEVIMPSYTFPSTANAFIRQGAKVVFADSRSDHPGINEESIEPLISKRTKAIVPVHYAGVACDMDRIMNIADKHNLFVIEDAAHGIDGYYKTHPLGSIGHLGCISFHETKNLQCGQGGALIINVPGFSGRADIIIEKGTNRGDFIRQKTDRYEWVDIGSSFGISELHAAYLYAQLEKAAWIKLKRISLWKEYFNSLLKQQDEGFLQLPVLSGYADHNAHIFYIILKNSQTLFDLKNHLANFGIQTVTHYTSLDRTKFWLNNGLQFKENSNSDRFNDCLLRLPLYADMKISEVCRVVKAVSEYFKNR